MLDTKQIDKLIKKHLRPAKKGLKCSRKHKKQLYSQVFLSVKDYIKINPNVNEKEVCDFLGEPQKIVADFKQRIGNQEIIKAYRRSKWIITGVSVLCAIALVLAWYVIFVFVIPPDIDTYYLDAQGVYQLDENGSRVYLESAPEGAPEFYYE